MTQPSAHPFLPPSPAVTPSDDELLHETPANAAPPAVSRLSPTLSPPLSSTPSRQPILASFGHALTGVVYTLRMQRNMQIHVTAVVCVTIAGLWLGLSLGEWATILVVSGMVLVAELLNTAVEAAVDLASPQWHPVAKTAKDAAAGAVLMSAMTSVVVGILILGPPLWSRITAQQFAVPSPAPAQKELFNR